MCGGQHPALVLARDDDAGRAARGRARVLEARGVPAQQRAAAELLPYLEGKQPTQVEISRRNDVVLIMPSGRGNLSAEQLDAIAAEAREGMADGIDWTEAEIIDVLPSLSGTPLQAGSPSSSEQSAG
jgi:hypothetical protein